MKLPKDDPLILAILRAVQGFPPGGPRYLAYFDEDPAGDWNNVRDNLLVPILGVLGYPDEGMERQESAERDGAELLVRGPEGQPFLMASVRAAQGRRLHLYRPYFLNSQFKKSGASIGILTDGDGIEVWERRGGLMLKLVELRLTAAVRCLEAGGGPEPLSDDMWLGLQRVAAIERSFQFPLRFGEPPPEPRDASLAENRSSFLGDMSRIAHLVRWDIRARHGGALGDLSRALPEQDTWGEAPPAPSGDLPSRILSCFRHWVEGRTAENPVSLLKPYLEELVHFTSARLFVMRYYEEKGLLGRPEGLAREGAPSGVLYQYERMRRVYPDFFGSGPFDWYLPDETTTRAIRLCLDRHKVTGLAAWEAYDLVCAGEKRLKGEILGWLATEAVSLATTREGQGRGSDEAAAGPRVLVVDGGDGLTILALAHSLFSTPPLGRKAPGEGAREPAPSPGPVEVLAQDPGSAAFGTLGYLIWAADTATHGEPRAAFGAPIRADPLPMRVLTWKRGGPGPAPDAGATASVTGGVEKNPAGPIDLVVADLSAEGALRNGLDWLAEMARVRPGGVVALLADAGVAPLVQPPSIASFVSEDPVSLKLVNFCGLEDADGSGLKPVAVLYRKKEGDSSATRGKAPAGPGWLAPVDRAEGHKGKGAEGPGLAWPAAFGRGARERGRPAGAEVIRDFRCVQDLVFGSFVSVHVPIDSVLDRKVPRFRLDYHPKRESVIAAIQKDASPLGSFARIFQGIDAQGLEEDIRWRGDAVETEGAGDPSDDGMRLVGSADIDRYQVKGPGRRWNATRGDGTAHPLVEELPAGALGPKIVVRVQARRILAALDIEGAVPVEPTYGIVPIAMESDEKKALLAILNSEMATLALRAWGGAPPEAGDRIDLGGFLDWFPLRSWPPGRASEIARHVEGIHFCNDTIAKRLAKLGSFERLAKEAWVTLVGLKEAKRLVVSWKIPSVARGLGPVVREGKTVSAGEDLSFVCRNDETACYLEEMLRGVHPLLEGKTLVDIEGLLKMPRSEAEITLLLRHAGRVREGAESFLRQSSAHEREIDRIVAETYGLGPADLEALREA